jgi:hypothetical protein
VLATFAMRRRPIAVTSPTQVAGARKIEAALDSIRERFGRDAVQKGLAFPFDQR